MEIGHDLSSCERHYFAMVDFHGPLLDDIKVSSPNFYPIRHTGTRGIKEVQCQIGPYAVTLVDTLGFDDTSCSDTEILSLIATRMQSSYESEMLLSGIIYLHRISDIRMTRSSLKNLTMFRKLCGAENMANVVLVATMCDKVSSQEGERREKELFSTGS